MLLHGFTDTWRTWTLVLDALQDHHDVLAVTLPGHAGGPPLSRPVRSRQLADAVEVAMDAAGWETAHVAGNSLGGYVALQLAERDRARSVAALAPAGGWAPGDDAWRSVLAYFAGMQEQVRQAAPHAAAIAATPAGRRAATRAITEASEHLPPELVEHLIVGAARCDGAQALMAEAAAHGWPLEPARVRCPLRFVWGTDDRLLPWPAAAAGYRAAFPAADWIDVEHAGHCPQLDVPLQTAQLILGLTAP